MIGAPKPVPIRKDRKRLTSTPRPIPTAVKTAVFARDDYLCQWCRVSGGALDAHHRFRRSQGGRDVAGHLVSVHRTCHRYIHEHIEEARERGFLVRSEDELPRGWT